MDEITTRTHTTLEDVETLRERWDELLELSDHHSATQAYAYSISAWNILAAKRGTSLNIISAWHEDRLVGIWPLYAQQYRVAVELCHLGCGSFHEYSDPVVESGELAPRIAHVLLGAAKARADLVRACNLRSGGVSWQAFRDDSSEKRSVLLTSPVVRLRQAPDWDAWVAKKSRSFRQGLRADWKRLSEIGDLRFVQMFGPVDGPRCMDWIFSQKRAWLLRQNIRHSWVLEDEGYAHYALLAERSGIDRKGADDILFHALMLDDRIIAAGMSVAGSDRFEFNMMASDPEFAKFGPGSLLTQESLKLALERGVDFDFRISNEAYKKRWIDDYDHYETITIASNSRGVAALRIRDIRQRIQKVRAKVGPIIKGPLRQWGILK